MPNDKDTALTLQRKYFGDPQGLAQHLVNICLNQIGVVRRCLQSKFKIFQFCEHRAFFALFIHNRFSLRASITADI